MMSTDQRAYIKKLIVDADPRTQFYFKNKKLKSELTSVCQPLYYTGGFFAVDEPAEILKEIEQIFESHRAKVFSEEEHDKLHEQIKTFYQERLCEIVSEVLAVPKHLI